MEGHRVPQTPRTAAIQKAMCQVQAQAQPIVYLPAASLPPVIILAANFPAGAHDAATNDATHDTARDGVGNVAHDTPTAANDTAIVANSLCWRGGNGKWGGVNMGRKF